MLDHIGFSIRNLKVSRMFYEKALKPLGIRPLMEVTPEMTGTDDSHVGFGADRPFFWIGTSDKPSPGMHVAFLAQSRKMVDEFYAVSVERRITHPCVVAITDAARGQLFG